MPHCIFCHKASVFHVRRHFICNTCLEYRIDMISAATVLLNIKYSMYYFFDHDLCSKLDWDYNDKVEDLFKEMTNDGDYIFIIGGPSIGGLCYTILDIYHDNDEQIGQVCFENGLPVRSCVYVTNKVAYKDSGHIKTIYMKSLF